MNTTSQDAARISGMRVVALIVLVRPGYAPPPLASPCRRIASACVPGYYGSGCSACPSGKFSAAYQQSACTDCPPGWDTQGFAGQSLCWPTAVPCGARGPCPRNHCGAKCLPCGCAVDSYANTLSCAAGACIRCPMPTQYTDALGECRACEDGFIFIFNGGCRRCPAGSYALRGRECVSQCPSNFYRNTPLTCAACPLNSTTDASGVCVLASCGL
jgi:hypothetical protein